MLSDILDGAQATGNDAFSALTDIFDLSKVDPKLVSTSHTSPISQVPHQSQTPSIWSKTSRTRSRNESDIEDEQSSKKQRKKEKIDIGQAITYMVDELRKSREAKQWLKEQKTIQEKAIEILYKDYEDRLTDEGFVVAINTLEADTKAHVFTMLKEGEKRDRWLEIAAVVELLPRSDN
jgi:hypothetical protein